MIRIAIVGDTLSRARRLATLLAEDDRLDVVDVQAATPALNSTAEVLVGIALLGADFPEAGVPVVLLTDARPEFNRNIHAFLPLAASPAEIAAAITAAASGLTVLTQEQSLRWIPSPMGSDRQMEQLTARELQVLRLVADGNGNKDIAAALGISEHTAKFHVAQILAKLDATSRTEAVSIGMRRGLIAI